MQVQSTQSTTANYDNSIQKSQETSSSKFDMTKPFDINTFSFEDYKNISAQELSDWIMNGDRPGDGFEAITFNNLASYTDDDDLNEIIFDKAKELFKQNDGSMRGIFESFLLPLANMNSPIEIKEDTFYNNKPIPYQEDYVNKFDEYATRSSLYSIDNVLNNIKNMPDFYEKNKDNFTWIDDTAVLDFFDDVLKKYENKKNVNNAVLDNYTKNNKPNALAV